VQIDGKHVIKKFGVYSSILEQTFFGHGCWEKNLTTIDCGKLRGLGLLYGSKLIPLPESI